MKKIGKETDTLERVIREIIDIIVYQPDIPMDHKTSLVEAFSEYRKSIGRPLRIDAGIKK